ncbi:MAG: zinc ribbon domain-containing protein [Candidatus Berkelbacteria bacterium]
MVIICKDCNYRDVQEDAFCPKCGAALRESCPVCLSWHPATTKFCPHTGENLEEYRAKVAKKNAVKKEFDEIFPTEYHKLCLLVRWKAFATSLICWEAVLMLIWRYLIKPMDTGGSSAGMILVFAIIILLATLAATKVSYSRMREELLDRFFEKKNRNSVNKI